MFAKFETQMNIQDQEYEKDIDSIIDEKIKEGLDDARIIDQIVSGGQHTSSQDDIYKMEKQKQKEYMKKVKQEGH